MKVRHWLAAMGAAALLLPVGLNGQERDWSVDLMGGAVVFPESSALETGPSLGIEALYHITPNLSIGPLAEYVRTETDGSFFVAAIDFGADSTRVFEAAQRISVLQYGGQIRFDFSPSQRISPYLVGGAGGYTLYLDTQSNDGFKRITNRMLQGGGGIQFNVTDATGFQIEVRDFIYSDFDRDQFNPILPTHRNVRPDGTVRFPGAERSSTPANESTIHNIRLTVGLTYVPGTGN